MEPTEPEPTMDNIDKAILNRIQSDFPITSRPYLTVADELNLTEKEVLDRVSRLKEMGIIRRIGGNSVPNKLGYVSTLCAARVPLENIELLAVVVKRVIIFSISGSHLLHRLCKK